MQIDTIKDGFFSFWDAQEFEQAQGTNKLGYRIIGGYKFQFRLCEYKKRTALAIEVMSIAKELVPIFTSVTEQIDAAGDEDQADKLAVQAIPALLGALARPELQPVLDKLCATASVDRGQGKFEPLTDELVAEAVFGEDITLQIPVAITAAMFNFHTLFAKLGAQIN